MVKIGYWPPRRMCCCSCDEWKRERNAATETKLRYWPAQTGVCVQACFSANYGSRYAIGTQEECVPVPVIQ
jgi:hypothetical protein